MIITVPKSNNVRQDDLIALTEDEKFLGYATVQCIMNETMILKVDNKIKRFNELIGEDIKFSVDIN
jgi:hypothetical protein